jgi:putative ABC transport system permease protein
VTPEGFQGTSVLTGDLWVPINMVGDLSPRLTGSILRSRQSVWLVMGARLKPGVSVRQAQEQLASIGQQLEREFPRENRGKGLRVVAQSPLPGNGGPVAAFFAVLMGIVSLVLAIACANVAGVLLARATARRREIAVRLAIGAGRWRLVRQMLVESTLLFVLGGAIGLALARVMTTLLLTQLPSLPIPIDMSLPLDLRAVSFTLGLSLVAAVAAGLAPALHGSRADVVGDLKADAQSRPDRQRLRNAFVVGQVAFSIMLVVAAALFVRALERAGAIDPGFDPRGVELAALDLSLAGYTPETGRVFANELIQRVRGAPGVQSAALSAMVPLSGGGLGLGGLTVPGATAPGAGRPASVDWNVVTPGYFAAMKMRLASGRDFTDGDRDGSPPVVIVNETAARRWWPNQDPLGKTLLQQDAPEPARTLTVVAVARDSKYRSLGEDPRLFVYVPIAQQYVPRVTIVARSTQGQRLAAELRGVLASLDANLPIVSSVTFDEHAALGLVPQRVAASVSGSLGLVGLLLAAMGIYGVTAYRVTSRTREIGVRVALGAQPGDVVRMVLRQGVVLALGGVAIGLALAAVAARLIESLLFGVGSTDPIAFAGSAVLFVVIALAACFVPARRAVSVDAMRALRHE